MTLLTLQACFARRSSQPIVTVALASAMLCGGALVQNNGSPEHIKAVMSALYSAAIKANTASSNGWPTIGVDYAETRFSKLDDINAGNVKQLGSSIL